MRIGNASGSVIVDGSEYQLNSKSAQISCGNLNSGGVVTFNSIKGKLGDSEDSFLFFCVKIMPHFENFKLSAVFTVTDASGPRHWQDGYGIFAADTITSSNIIARYRNLLSAGRYRMENSQICSAGVRAVAGHSDVTAAGNNDRRCLDSSRAFHRLRLPTDIQAGEQMQITLCKTDLGFCSTINSDKRQQKNFFPGCSFLEVQEKDAIYIGFGVAGNICLEVSQIHFTVSPGRPSFTPQNAVRNIPPDYPFSRNLRPKKTHISFWKKSLSVAVAGTDGTRTGKGTRESPLSLTAAIASGAHEIILLDGIYSVNQPLLLLSSQRKSKRLIRADHPGCAVLDGSDMADIAPIMILNGSNWVLDGITFLHGPSVGLYICGDNNRVLRCRASENADTGILICAWPGEPRQRWPKNNSIEQCESCYNCDPASSNADGFGAKLSVGEGNRFSDCLAHHNIDDGFDLYTKLTLGPIGAVKLENCAAFYNGKLSSETAFGDGSGFKLGGEGISVPHEVYCCAACSNAKAGFFLNSNPAPHLKHLMSWNNGADGVQNYRLNTRRKNESYDLAFEDLQEAKSLPNSLSSSDTGNKLPERDSEGRLLLDKFFIQQDKEQTR